MTRGPLRGRDGHHKNTAKSVTVITKFLFLSGRAANQGAFPARFWYSTSIKHRAAPWLHWLMLRILAEDHAEKHSLLAKGGPRDHHIVECSAEKGQRKRRSSSGLSSFSATCAPRFTFARSLGHARAHARGAPPRPIRPARALAARAAPRGACPDRSSASADQRSARPQAT